MGLNELLHEEKIRITIRRLKEGEDEIYDVQYRQIPEGIVKIGGKELENHICNVHDEFIEKYNKTHEWEKDKKDLYRIETSYGNLTIYYEGDLEVDKEIRVKEKIIQVAEIGFIFNNLKEKLINFLGKIK